MHTLLQAEQYNSLSGIIHIDDGYFGGKRQGSRDCGEHGKTPLIIISGLRIKYMSQTTQGQWLRCFNTVHSRFECLF